MPSLTDVRRPRLYLLQWLKSDKALMMLFNDGTFQVSLVASLEKMFLKYFIVIKLGKCQKLRGESIQTGTGFSFTGELLSRSHENHHLQSE